MGASGAEPAGKKRRQVPVGDAFHGLKLDVACIERLDELVEQDTKGTTVTAKASPGVARHCAARRSCSWATAIEVTDDRSIRSLVRGVVVRSGVGGMIESVSNDPLFEFDLEQIDVAHWLDIGQPGTHAARSEWRAK